MNLETATSFLVGRDSELALLERLLEGLPDRGGAVVVRGEAGIGKTSLLSAVRRRAADGGTVVLTTSGVESEAQLAFAGLHALLRPALHNLGRLPEPQREAVEAAFGMADRSAPDLFLIALAALDLLADLASESSLLLVVEDAQWLDTATLDVLAFVARRVELEPIALVFAVREGHGGRLDGAGLPALRLAGLDDESAAALLDATAPDLLPHVRTRVLTEAVGNPLALLELPRALREERFEPSPGEPLPLTEQLERAFAARASELPDAASALVLVAALDPDGDLRHILEAASRVAERRLAVEDFGPVVGAQLATVGHEGVRFRHPLVRSAIHQRAALGERIAAHAALADAYADDPDRRAWHLAASVVAPDEAIVAELEALASRSRRRGGAAGAAAALARAAQLTADPARRAELLVQAAEIEFDIGRHEVSRRLLEEAQVLDQSPQVRTRLTFLAETFDGGWSGAAKIPAFVGIANDAISAGQVDQALEALLAVALRCWWANPDRATRDSVVGAARRLPLEPGDPLLVGILALADPVDHAALVMERLSSTAVSAASPEGMLLLGSAAQAVWAENLSLPFLTAAVDGLRAQGRLGLLAQALVCQAWGGVHTADARLASPAAAEGLRLAEETGQPRWAAAGRLALAAMAAERGDPGAAAQLTTEAETVLLPMGANPMLALVQFVRGRAAIVESSFPDAYDALRRIFDPADIAHQPFIGAWAFADFVDAAAHGGGDVDHARTVLDGYVDLAERTQAPLLRAQVSYALALLADDADADDRFTAALTGGDLVDWRCYRGRLLLAHGAWLRRQRRAAESRTPLRAAAETFDALGFASMADRARQELRASGETSRPRVPEAWDQLSPQELQIARMAAAGMTNREIGQRLYLSHRTIGSHLYRIFPKLGITSRSQLREVLEDSSSGSDRRAARSETVI